MDHKGSYTQVSGQQELVQPVTTKAPSTLLLIIEKQHDSWDLMGIASPAVDLVHRAPRATLTVVRGAARFRMSPLTQQFRVLSPNHLECGGGTKCFVARARRLTRLRRVSSASNVEWPCRGSHCYHLPEGSTTVSTQFCCTCSYLQTREYTQTGWPRSESLIYSGGE